MQIKGIVHPEMKIPSSTHHQSGGGVGEVFESRNTSGVSGVKFVAAESVPIEVNSDQDFRLKKTTWEWGSLNAPRRKISEDLGLKHGENDAEFSFLGELFL